MRKLLSVMTLLIFCGTLAAGELVVKNVKASVEARSGVSEEWIKLKAGDVLKSDNTIKTGKNSSVTVVAADGRVFVIPELTMLEVSDLRNISQEDLLLKLAMADIRGVPPQNGSGEISIPNTTIIHGKKYAAENRAPRPAKGFRDMEVNGTKVLYNYAFYPTCVLRAKEMLRFYPELKSRFEFRMMIANALEKSNLRGEALNEYIALCSEKLPPSQKAVVEENSRRLKRH